MKTSWTCVFQTLIKKERSYNVVILVLQKKNVKLFSFDYLVTKTPFILYSGGFLKSKKRFSSEKNKLQLLNAKSVL